MMREDTNGRTHEPALRELTSDLDGLRELVMEKFSSNVRLLDERDRLYKERDESRKVAVDAALTSVKEQTKASFEASEKAIVKAEEAQKAYNASHNDLARKMDEQSKATMPRTETETRFAAIQEKVEEIRRTLSGGTGIVQGAQQVRDDSRANLAAFVGLVALLFTLWSHFAVGK